jgi:hypothetical protein
MGKRFTTIAAMAWMSYVGSKWEHGELAAWPKAASPASTGLCVCAPRSKRLRPWHTP